MCTGRFACRNARIAISTAMSGMPPIDEDRFARAFAREIETTAARAPGREVVVDLSRRRHAVPDAAANRRRHSGCDRQALARRSRCRSHAGSQSHQRRGDAFWRLSLRRRQPGVARRAGAGRRLAEGVGTPAYRARSARCGRDRAQRVRSLFVRSDLRPPRPDAADVGRRTEARDRGSGRASVALSADHRRGHAVLRPACRGQIEDAGRSDRARALRRHPGGLRRARPAGLRDFQSRAAGRASAGTIWSTGAARNMPASAPARMAGSISTASGTRSRPKNAPRPG